MGDIPNVICVSEGMNVVIHLFIHSFIYHVFIQSVIPNYSFMLSPRRPWSSTVTISYMYRFAVQHIDVK